jgi:hypothetical protein
MVKKISAIAITSAVAGTQIAFAKTKVISVRNLSSAGINTDVVALAFQSQVGVKVNLNEMLKVRAEDEGKNIRFETLDNFSVVVPIQYAMGPFNKDGRAN